MLASAFVLLGVGWDYGDRSRTWLGENLYGPPFFDKIT